MVITNTKKATMLLIRVFLLHDFGTAKVSTIKGNMGGRNCYQESNKKNAERNIRTAPLIGGTNFLEIMDSMPDWRTSQPGSASHCAANNVF